MGWTVERWEGSAAEFHAREVPEQPEPAVWWFEVDRPAIVLGSSQPASDLDAAACARTGVEIVRRRSGGGAVLLEPGGAAWIDVVLPAGHPLSDDDVGRASWWLGEAWADALAALGYPGAAVHRGPMVTTDWSGRICFAGVGPGEVLIAGAKAVGISQRRTRRAARFQCALALRWDPERLIALLSPPLPTVEALIGAVFPVPTTPNLAAEALVHALNARI